LGVYFFSCCEWFSFVVIIGWGGAGFGVGAFSDDVAVNGFGGAGFGVAGWVEGAGFGEGLLFGFEDLYCDILNLPILWWTWIVLRQK
jgi:hypothetical protein